MHMLLAGRNKTNFPLASLIRAMVSATKYSSNLNNDDKEKNKEKLIAADGSTVLPDLYTLVENWKENYVMLCLPW